MGGASGSDGDLVTQGAHGDETFLTVYGQQHGRMGLLVGLGDGQVRFVECGVVVVLPLEAGEMVLSPELFHDLQELIEVVPAIVRAARPRSRAVDEPALADLVDDGYLLRGLERVVQHQIIEGVSFMRQRSFR